MKFLNFRKSQQHPETVNYGEMLLLSVTLIPPQMNAFSYHLLLRNVPVKSSNGNAGENTSTIRMQVQRMRLVVLG